MTTVYRPTILAPEVALSWWARTGTAGLSEVECALCLSETMAKLPGAPEFAQGKNGEVPLADLWPWAIDHLLHTHGVVLSTVDVPREHSLASLE